MTVSNIKIQYYESPCGTMVIGVVEAALCLCDWLTSPHRQQVDRTLVRQLHAEMVEENTPLAQQTITELDEYFAGQRKTFDLPIRWVGTPFQCQVWSELSNIAYGNVLSYKALAQRLGQPKAVRAVAHAVGLNPLPILVPCHRVVGRGGKLTGYSGGLEAKSFLLQLENGLEQHLPFPELE